jgi:cellobiose epimerase
VIRRPRAGIAIDQAGPVIERLLDQMLDFWDERIIDRNGYRLGHDRRGRAIPGGAKHLVTQARVAWFFARLARSRFGEPRHLDWAAHGVEFLRGWMWDGRHGGFVWRVDLHGEGDTRKHLYGQAFAVFALSEFSRAAGDAEAAAFAEEAVRLFPHDDAHGGFFEARARDWSPEPPRSTSVLGRPARCKTTNAHIHLTEALTELAVIRPDSQRRAWLEELVGILSGPVVDDRFGTLWDSFERDWRPLPGYPCSYGHDVEQAWLLAHACEAVGLPQEPLAPLRAALWENALTHGFDHARGGLFESGPRGQRATRRAKLWWVQAEALVSALRMWRATGDQRYRRAFERTLGWIDRAQVDRGGGDWHAAVGRFGRVSGDKSGAWKDPYHQGRALIECLELLDS